MDWGQIFFLRGHVLTFLAVFNNWLLELSPQILTSICVMYYCIKVMKKYFQLISHWNYVASQYWNLFQSDCRKANASEHNFKRIFSDTVRQILSLSVTVSIILNEGVRKLWSSPAIFTNCLSDFWHYSLYFSPFYQALIINYFEAFTGIQLCVFQCLSLLLLQ